MTPYIICLMGPTASGKTALALELAHTFPIEIVSVDSAMVYKGMDIGTAKPSQEERGQTPHHLIDILEPTEIFSAADFCEAANRLCDDILSRQKIPVLVGGTMMYFNAFLQGLSLLPAADVALRTKLEQEAMGIGWAQMHAKLSRIDPLSALQINVNDSQRIIRALEVFYLTGEPLSHLREIKKKKCAYAVVTCMLDVSNRQWLHERIAQRFLQMIDQGFLDEVQALKSVWDTAGDTPAKRCVGYRQALEHLSGQYDMALFCEKAIAATRQLAKRQLTWLRHWPLDGQRFFADREEDLQKMMDWIKSL